MTTQQSKPRKPNDNFPLFPHRNKQWAKKIRGKLHYFGSWSGGWEKALDNYERDREALYAGRDPRRPSELTVSDGCNLFLGAKKSLLASKAIAFVTYQDYEDTCRGIIAAFGRNRSVASLMAADFDALRASLAERLGPVSLGNEINRVRIVFRYLYEASLIESPVRFGPQFKRPSRKHLRLARAQAGSKLVTREEVSALLRKANSTLKAMIFLGLNAGLGNADIGHLHHSHLDLRHGWLVYPRPKTGISRKAKLWPETIKALVALPYRAPSNPEHKILVFLTHFGRPWALDSSDNPVAKEFRKLVKVCQLDRPGLSFYSLRHTFQTIGEESRDIPAVQFIMGHAPTSADMSSAYREAISDERIAMVCEHVRRWWRYGKKVSKRVS